MKWRAWYDGGRYFDSSTTEWKDLPRVGFQEGVLYFEHGYRTLLGGCDIYCIHDGRAYQRGSGDPSTGLREDLVTEALDAHPETVEGEWKLGTTIGDAEWRELRDLAFATREMP